MVCVIVQFVGVVLKFIGCVYIFVGVEIVVTRLSKILSNDL